MPGRRSPALWDNTAAGTNSDTRRQWHTSHIPERAQSEHVEGIMFQVPDLAALTTSVSQSGSFNQNHCQNHALKPMTL